MTPEKARLLKAMKMREKKKKMANASTPVGPRPLSTVQDTNAADEEETNAKVEDQPAKDAQVNEAKADAQAQTEAEAEAEAECKCGFECECEYECAFIGLCCCCCCCCCLGEWE